MILVISDKILNLLENLRKCNILPIRSTAIIRNICIYKETMNKVQDEERKKKYIVHQDDIADQHIESV